MKIRTFNFTLIVILSLNIPSLIFSQDPSWKLLPSSAVSERYDDVVFINPFTGWAVGTTNSMGAVNSAKIYKTTNGGINWQETYTFQGYYSRSICFVDALTGFMGSLNGSQHLWKTTNGGYNWDSVSFAGNGPDGICGLSYSGNTIIGSGTYYGVPKVIISTNRGAAWSVIDLDSYANALIDCYMKNENEAYVIGGIGPTYLTRRGVILYTSNRGLNWVTRFTSPHAGNWGWKISFPTLSVGYVSLENEILNDTSFFVKTTNGGLNWTEKPYGRGVDYREQGIGFVNESTGWMGGYNKFFVTTNGGSNWALLNISPEFTFINRIRFYGDTLGYAAGQRIYKYTSDNSIGIWAGQNNVPLKSSLFQNYPNPFNPVTVIKYEIFERSVSTIRIFNAVGEEVYTFSIGYRTPGIREFIWYGTDHNGNLVPSGVYFYKLETEKNTETKKMILVR